MGFWQFCTFTFKLMASICSSLRGCCGLPARETCNIHPGHHPFNQSGVGGDRGGGARVLFSFFFFFFPIQLSLSPFSYPSLPLNPSFFLFFKTFFFFFKCVHFIYHVCPLFLLFASLPQPKRHSNYIAFIVYSERSAFLKKY